MPKHITTISVPVGAFIGMIGGYNFFPTNYGILIGAIVGGLIGGMIGLWRAARKQQKSRK
jgi:membrane associated rhomboid family serine protease